MSAFRPCAIVPTYDNPATVRAVVTGIRAHLPEVVLVDDGSAAAGEAACRAIADDGLAVVHRFAANRGKGAALKAGFAIARERGFSHGFQIDADGQHDLQQVPPFLAAAAARPDALIAGYPIYGRDAPRSRLLARRITAFWVALEIGRRRLRDALIGFRVYPLEAALACRPRAERMGIDVELAVRMVRAGTPVVNLPVAVRYLAPEEGGVSHFRAFRDNVAFCCLHTRLCTGGMCGWLARHLLGSRR